MSDNPFLEPDDNEQTIIRPLPGGRPLPPREGAEEYAARDRQPDSAASSAAGGARFEDIQRTSQFLIVAAAAGCLSFLGRIHNTYTPPDPGQLREHAIAALKQFERTLRDDGVSLEEIRPAHYALCASMDDVVQATPWGNHGSWTNASLVSTFHQEVQSGERFFDLLMRVSRNPGRMLGVLELMYLCLCLGMQGRYRLSPRGPAELDRIREETFILIMRNRPAVERELSPHWKGVSAPYRPQRLVMPVWLAALAGAAVLGIGYMWVTLGVASLSDNLFASALSIPPGKQPQIERVAPVEDVVSTAPPTGDRVRLKAFLKPEIDEGLVEVDGTDAVPIVRIRGEGMFGSGTDELAPSTLPTLRRIGAALATEKGWAEVIGYTDSRPIHTMLYPSNLDLSRARAAAATEVMRGTSGPDMTLRVQGAGAANPIASNDTAAGQQKNRRIEVVLHRQLSDNGTQP
ncbi:type IVB secretion system protein IcmH/DotU [Acetobacter sp.]|jgi:type VI secretion system protein ImpK|uniref:type IVB secretion system protein IcmH/DotU n=1 Tax=Acetobacter sp. TaxID=440 RepID=UPI0025BD8C14|nr:type IVB secretion system protein IcmH/DotU [Acetobacter sp.]MCH4092648.1 type IVB secretion system protein IcmH/DotU [Acetobacter sp.]MCI1299782.1 type IVB secretion system protein IcmH/DotU [Acetobacter sp.]MCI1315338.1 type IVB secretion system protein IcmH/DotU [Acetobacter sp.]